MTDSNNENAKIEIINGFNAIYVAFGKAYKHKWFKKTQEENKAFFHEAINQLIESNVNPEFMQQAFDLIKTMKQFDVFPPSIQQYITICKSLERSTDSAEVMMDKATEKAADAAYRRLKVLYRGMWDKSQEDVDIEQYGVWMSMIHRSGVSAESISRACTELDKLSQYRNYPPTINAFMDIAKIIDSKEDIPLVESAYLIATSSAKEINKFVRIARQRFGYYELRVESGSKTRERFEAVYRQVIIDYFDGKIAPDEFFSDNTPENKIEINQEDKESFIEMLEKMRKNKAA